MYRILMKRTICSLVPCPILHNLPTKIKNPLNVTYIHSANSDSRLTKEYILSSHNRTRSVAKLRATKPIRVSDSTSPREAAVLVPLCEVQGELALLYTLRSPNMKQHKAQVCFPGGMRLKSDRCAWDTALRETEEEVGIDRNSVDVWGNANYVGTWRGNIVVVPVLGYIGPIQIEDLNLDHREVEHAFIMFLKDLCDSNNCKQTQFRRGYVIPAFVGGEYRVWGLSGIITHVMLKALVPWYGHTLHYIHPVSP